MKGSEVYFLRPKGAQGPVKIGSSVYPKSRLMTYQVWSPVELELVASIPAHHNTENFLHRHFLSNWLHGEWFAWSPDLQSLLDHINGHSCLPDWVTPPTNPDEYKIFLRKYPRGKTKRSFRSSSKLSERVA